jgi:hypothetical protein
MNRNATMYLGRALWDLVRYRKGLPEQRVLSASLGGAAAMYLPDGDRPAQAQSLEETMRRAHARCPSESWEQQDADLRNGYDIGPARRIGYGKP